MIKPVTTMILALLLSGCAIMDGGPPRGQLYTAIIQPRSTDFHTTPVGSRQCVLDEYQFKEPVSGYGVSVEWTADRILAAAKLAGITRISYTELETRSYIFGIYKRQRLIIHGD